MVIAVVEGHLDEHLLRVLWRQLGRDPAELLIRNAGGSGFWKHARRYNEASAYQTTIGLADLEQHVCPSAKLLAELPALRASFQIRLAVRMMEAWLLADRSSFAAFLGVGVAKVPKEPESIAHPKRLIVELARHSRKREIREGLVPYSTGAVVGPEYVPGVARFVSEHWSVDRARQSSPSLDRACRRWCELS